MTQYYCPEHGDLLEGTRSYRCANAPVGHEFIVSGSAPVIVGAVQWAPSGNPLMGIPSEVVELLSSDGRTYGYGYGEGWSIVFGHEHGDVTVNPKQWVVRYDNGLVCAQDEKPEISTAVADAWMEGYWQGVNDEIISRDSFGGEIAPSRKNPYK